MNVKLENPEVLTALFLLLLSFAAFKWLSESRGNLLGNPERRNTGVIGSTALQPAVHRSFPGHGCASSKEAEN